MKLRDVSISKGMTVNIGNHQFHKVEIGMTATFDEDDDFEAGMEKLTAMVNGKLATEINTAVSNATDGNQKGPKKQTLMEQKD